MAVWRRFYGQFGTYSNLKIAPLVGYRITKKLTTGLGVTYIYFSEKNLSGAYSTHIIGGSTFARYMIIDSFEDLIGLNFAGKLFGHAEYEGLSLERRYFDAINNNPENGRFWLSSIWLGGGFAFPIGENSGMYLSVLWDVLQNQNSLYASPLIRLGFYL